MTLIALHAEKHRATVMTDTWGYRFDLTMSATSKHVAFPHLGMIIAAQGSTGFQGTWLAETLLISHDTPTFDQFLEATPAALRRLWTRMSEDVEAENRDLGARATVAKTVIFQVGRSAELDRYVAYAYASEQNFEPIDLTELRAIVDKAESVFTLAS